MESRGQAIAERARALIGVRFRPQGRDPARGLDCIGLVAIAARVPIETVPRDYALRGEQRNEIEHHLLRLGFEPVAGAEVSDGDVLLMAAGPAQVHLGVAAAGGIIHADMGMGRVVERPGPPPWPLLSRWRREGGR